MAALVGARLNSVLKAHYTCFLERGKPRKVALIACARQLLTILNAILRAKTVWREPEPGAA